MKNSRGMKQETAKLVNHARQNSVVSRRAQHKSVSPNMPFLGTIGSATRGVAFSAHEKPDRNWRDIAQEASNEIDPERLTELANELTRALDEQIGSTRRWPRSKAVS